MSGYSPILELGDGPITPREKVTRLIDDAPEHQTADESADAIITALASGSGDHAELAKELRRADEYQPLGHDGWKAADAIEDLLAENAALRAARDDASASCTAWSRTVGEMASIGEGWKERCVEAERKLAEAVGLLSEVADEFGCTIEQYHKNGPHWTSADGEMFDVGVILDREPIIERIRTFLNKEAERG